MKYLAIILLLAATAYGQTISKLTGKCSTEDIKTEVSWNSMNNTCVSRTRDQIHMEIKASFSYLVMAAHFSKDTVNRPGFAELFFKAASEEREHAQHLIDYLNMRGQVYADIDQLIKIPKYSELPKLAEIKTGELALKKALALETAVTESIKEVIKVCEGDEDNDKSKDNNEYHLVDYLTGVFLEEQYKGQRELAGQLVTLSKMMRGYNSELGEFLFDKSLMS